MAAPLADRIRPQTLDEIVGQSHLLGKGMPLRRIAESGEIPNMVFYGPSGVGKTTVASILAKSTHKHLCKLNGTTASTADDQVYHLTFKQRNVVSFLLLV